MIFNFALIVVLDARSRGEINLICVHLTKCNFICKYTKYKLDTSTLLKIKIIKQHHPL